VRLLLATLLVLGTTTYFGASLVAYALVAAGFLASTILRS
jgi:hypothetical protein